MGDYMQRRVHERDVTIANGEAVSGAFDMRLYAMGIFTMPAAWTSASMGFKVCATEGGTFVPLYTKAAAICEVSAPAVDRAYEFPDAVAGAHWVKLWSQNGSAVDTNQGAARTIKLQLKA